MSDQLSTISHLATCSLLVVYPINGTMFENDYFKQKKLSKCSLKYSVISVVHR